MRPEDGCPPRGAENREPGISQRPDHGTCESHVSDAPRPRALRWRRGHLLENSAGLAVCSSAPARVYRPAAVTVRVVSYLQGGGYAEPGSPRPCGRPRRSPAPTRGRAGPHELRDESPGRTAMSDTASRQRTASGIAPCTGCTTRLRCRWDVLAREDPASRLKGERPRANAQMELISCAQKMDVRPAERKAAIGSGREAGIIADARPQP
jgi:hypothetical protein